MSMQPLLLMMLLRFDTKYRSPIDQNKLAT